MKLKTCFEKAMYIMQKTDDGKNLSASQMGLVIAALNGYIDNENDPELLEIIRDIKSGILRKKTKGECNAED